jgi:hypothetical protein
MSYHPWHRLIIAYRLEDKNGNSPFYITSTKNHFPHNVYPDYEDYRYAYLDLTKFLEPEYLVYYHDDNYFLYEYLLRPIMTSVNGEAVSFRQVSVVSRLQLSKIYTR